MLARRKTFPQPLAGILHLWEGAGTKAIQFGVSLKARPTAIATGEPLTWSNRLSCSTGSDSWRGFIFLLWRTVTMVFWFALNLCLVGWSFFHSSIHSFRDLFQTCSVEEPLIYQCSSIYSIQHVPFQNSPLPCLLPPFLDLSFSHWHPIRR